MITQIYSDKKPKGKVLTELRKKYHDIPVTVWIGKEGLTENVIKEIEKQLEQKEVIKVRILKNLLRKENKTRKEIMIEICKKLLEKGIKVIDIRGYTILLTKKLL